MTGFTVSPVSISHVSIVVPDIAAAAAALREKYGLETGAPTHNEQQGVRLAYIDLGRTKIEVMEPSRPDSPVAKFLERNPRGGIHHFSLAVDDVAQASAELRARGVRLLGSGPQHNVMGDPIAFIHPHDFLGALVELEQRKADPPGGGHDAPVTQTV